MWRGGPQPGSTPGPTVVAIYDSETIISSPNYFIADVELQVVRDENVTGTGRQQYLHTGWRLALLRSMLLARNFVTITRLASGMRRAMC